MHEADVVVVGTGIAGLVAASVSREQGRRVTILTKGRALDSNTRYAQGGLAAAIGPDDSPARHFEDTLAAGAGINDPSAVEVLTDEAGACLQVLARAGVRFDGHDGRLELTTEGGHHSARVLHAGGDATGSEIARRLLAHVRAQGAVVVEHARVTELALSGDRVTGVRAIVGPMPAETQLVPAGRVILATGGAGGLFSRTTNPPGATGDGLALAYRAGAELMDLELFQFHPTALTRAGCRPFLISEAVRGEGGILLNAAGERFMQRYHPDAELAPRDVVARAIWNEMSAGGPVLLNMTHLGEDHLRHRFPTIIAGCARSGVDAIREPIPVAPAAHYFMGGVRSDLDGRTTLSGLFVAGEVACTGVHGANRLASNSLLEGLVFGRRAALAADGRALSPIVEPSPPDDSLGAGTSDARLLRQRNWQRLGIVRDGAALEQHLEWLTSKRVARRDPVAAGTERVRNLVLLSRLLAESALMRTESRGAHYRLDHPHMDPRWRGNIVVSRHGRAFRPLASPLLARIPA